MNNLKKKMEYVPKYEQTKKNLYAEPKFMIPPDATKLPKPFQTEQSSLKNN